MLAVQTFVFRFQSKRTWDLWYKILTSFPERSSLWFDYSNFIYSPVVFLKLLLSLWRNKCMKWFTRKEAKGCLSRLLLLLIFATWRIDTSPSWNCTSKNLQCGTDYFFGLHVGIKRSFCSLLKLWNVCLLKTV